MEEKEINRAIYVLIIKKAMSSLFTRSRSIMQNTDVSLSFNVEVSYMEIYNEKVGQWGT